MRILFLIQHNEKNSCLEIMQNIQILLLIFKMHVSVMSAMKLWIVQNVIISRIDGDAHFHIIAIM